MKTYMHPFPTWCVLQFATVLVKLSGILINYLSVCELRHCIEKCLVHSTTLQSQKGLPQGNIIAHIFTIFNRYLHGETWWNFMKQIPMPPSPFILSVNGWQWGLGLLAIVSSSIQLWSVNTVSALNKSCKTSKNLFQLWKTNCELEVCVPTDTQFLFVEQSTYGFFTFISYRSGINKIIKL